MKRFLFFFLGLVTLAGVSALLADPAPADVASPWVLRQQALYLTGLWSFSLMSLAMVLATRPTWLEPLLGGMDQIYRTHKWTGILAVGFAAAHWLVEMSDDVIKAMIGREGRFPKEHGSGFLAMMRDVGEDLGEWAIYALLAMLVITLLRRFPYHLWRYAHHAMPVIYLMLVIHSAFLAPVDWWTGPTGPLLALLIAAGSAAALLSLAGRIGRRRKVGGTVESFRDAGAGVTEVVCRLEPGWKGHKAGQFAFATFQSFEGAHPFTIASADRGDRRITFQIKALGDYTRRLGERLHQGQPVTIEGPYGRFDFRRGATRARQIWIAGGIGVTPFLAWLESLQGAENVPDADLYYSTRARADDPFVTRLEALCKTLPTVRLHIISTDRDGVLNAELLHQRHGDAKRTDIWFCGPRPFGDALRAGLTRLGMRGVRFHQEAFEMR